MKRYYELVLTDGLNLRHYIAHGLFYEEVKHGNEKSVAQTFVKAMKDYLDKKYEFADELKWVKENKEELSKILASNRSH